MVNPSKWSLLVKSCYHALNNQPIVYIMKRHRSWPMSKQQFNYETVRRATPYGKSQWNVQPSIPTIQTSNYNDGFMCGYSGETADILQMAVAAPNFIQQNLHILCYVYRSTICTQCPGSKTLNRVTSKVWWCIRYPLGRERTYVSRYLCSPVPMFPEPMFPGAYVPRYLCSPVPMFPEPMFPGAYVPRYRCSPVPMFPDFCTLTVVISINRLQIPPPPGTIAG